MTKEQSWNIKGFIYEENNRTKTNLILLCYGCDRWEYQQTIFFILHIKGLDQT